MNRKSCIPGFRRYGVFVLLLILIPSRVLALEIHEIRWSFHDRPVAYHFNPVTLLVENNKTTPFEGKLRFQPESFRGQTIGLALAKSIYIAPYEKKWVQFYPYFTESNANWSVDWEETGRHKSKSFLAPVPTHERAAVQLVSFGSLERLLPGIKQYPEEIFPPFSATTDSLESVVLNHVPKWDKARRTAFLEWIYSGGTVHLFKNASGNALVFSESFAPLDRMSNVVSYGKGRIFRHQIKIDQLSSAKLSRVLRTIQQNPEQPFDGEEKLADAYSYDPAQGYYPHAGFLHSNMSDEEILTTLTEMSKPQRIWYFNFFISFLYLVVVGPGYYIVTRLSQKTYYYYVCYFLGTALFSLIFLISGKYSSNQTSQVHSLFLANVLPDREIELSEWSSLGIVNGGTYEISHLGDEHLYAACNEFSRINGISTSGSQGMLKIEMPPSSTQSFLHKAKTRKTVFEVAVESVLTNESGLEALTLKINDQFPSQVKQIYFQAGPKLYELKQDEERLVYHGTSRKISTVLDYSLRNAADSLATFRLTGTVKPRETPDKLPLDQLFPVLLKRALGIESVQTGSKQQSNVSTGKLLVLCDAPDELILQSPQVTNKYGLVLYCLEVPLKIQID
ncbi:hypothetical protein Enr10x_58230 [Gimesia panareensis]|uniref:Uncharacterized protein n=1 Tax=Gimesia panareensis TaxID=2527978 RepID=A0A517QFZ0_9PLAN|nr:hypothetical protein [Gimesia panareensis]QDT30457.1 hypothetical protein Enr10x_58230 [Gimesia panareensis]